MIIGISGKINSGKDTIGKIIQYLTMQKIIPRNRQSFEEFLKHNNIIVGYGYWEIKKFADKLKDMICLLLNCTREQLEDREFKEAELLEEWRIWSVWVSYTEKAKIFASKEAAEKFHYEVWDDTGTHIKSYIPTPRKLFQLLGTDCGRNIIHPNIWVNALMSEYYPLDTVLKDGKKWTTSINDPDYFNVDGQMYKERKHFTELSQPFSSHPKSNWIITDVRFPNELEAVKKRSGITIRVTRPKDILDMGQIMPKEHPSETALDNAKFDYSIDNNGSILDLIAKVKEILTIEKII